ncbi:MAG: site-specific DNA-methyltransferase [Syntrophaceticus sp.]
MTKEQLFFKTLKDIFVGAQVKGKSGYIRLMQIRSHYYKKHFLPSLKDEIHSQLSPFPEYREEIFEQLSTFFSSYLRPGGSLYFYKTTQHPSFYDKAFKGTDVFLYWTTHMLHYVKTDHPLNNLEIELDGIRFFFDVSGLKQNKSIEKPEISYQFQGKQEDGTLIFAVEPTERRKKKKFSAILHQLQKEGVQITEETIKSAISLFESQGERDYFINKDASNFLKEQFGLWMYQNLCSRDTLWNEEQITKMQILQKITFKIISSISQFEEELLRIWNKPKFVRKANYVITIDRIAQKDVEVLSRLASHTGYHLQVDEWQKLGLVDEGFQLTDIFEEGSVDSPEKCLSNSYCHLPIDTKHFKDLEGDILSLFDHLDEQLDGWLIKSENYQALNTILPKFKERVQVIYIDPPFNREQDPGYSYSVNYKDAAWITLLENRLQLALKALSKTGCIFVRCDYNGNMYVRLLMDQIFGPENFKNEIIIKRSGIQKQAKNKLLVATDSLFFYSKADEGKPKDVYEHRETNWLPFVHYPGTRRSNKNRLVFDYILEPPQGRHWGLKQELINKWVSKGWVRFRCRNCGHEHYQGEWKGCPLCGSQEFIPELKNPPKKIDSNWTNIQSYSQDPAFPTRNAEDILKRVFDVASAEGDLVMDFFLGSGTATAVAQKMKRKWIGIEMGNHFYTYVLPRMKKVLAGEQTGISKEVNWQGGGFFKYCELEQYEDTMSKMEYEGLDSPAGPDMDPFHRYTFLADQVMLDALERKTPQIRANPSLLYDDVDIPGSLSCITGKWIQKITTGKIEFQDGSTVNTNNFDWKLIKPFIWW